MKLDPELAIAKTKTDFQQSNLTQLGTKFRNQKSNETRREQKCKQLRASCCDYG